MTSYEWPHQLTNEPPTTDDRVLVAVASDGVLAVASQHETRTRGDAPPGYSYPAAPAGSLPDPYNPRSRSIAWVSRTFGILWLGSPIST